MTDLNINGHPEMITWPNAINGLREGKEGRLDAAVRVWVRFHAANEDIVDATPVVRLPKSSVLSI